jgi:hypothetical protein
MMREGESKMQIRPNFFGERAGYLRAIWAQRSSPEKMMPWTTFAAYAAALTITGFLLVMTLTRGHLG